MEQKDTFTHNKAADLRLIKLYRQCKRLFFTLILCCSATFFIQAEDDETSMYIILVVIIVIIGLVNLVKWIFPKKRRRDKDGHKPRHHQHTHSENGK